MQSRRIVELERRDDHAALEIADAIYRGLRSAVGQGGSGPPDSIEDMWRQSKAQTIASVTAPFCGACTRARLSAEGELFTCLFAARGTDLRAPLRDGADDAELEARIRSAWGARDDRYSELRSAGTANLPRVEMFAIGG